MSDNLQIKITCRLWCWWFRLARLARWTARQADGRIGQYAAKQSCKPTKSWTRRCTPPSPIPLPRCSPPLANTSRSTMHCGNARAVVKTLCVVGQKCVGSRPPRVFLLVLFVADNAVHWASDGRRHGSSTQTRRRQLDSGTRTRTVASSYMTVWNSIGYALRLYSTDSQRYEIVFLLPWSLKYRCVKSNLFSSSVFTT